MILIKNTDVFDGKHARLHRHVQIIIDGNKVREITDRPVAETSFARVIDGAGYTAIPGLTDAHIHFTLISSMETLRYLDDVVVCGVKMAKDVLMRGFTTVREAGGMCHGLKMGIDRGLIDGPRIYPSHAFLSQTCGHGDCAPAHVNRDIQYRVPSVTVLADGVNEVLRAAREQLYLGASQIKIMAGGGCGSLRDHLYTQQYTLEEMKAAVAAAEDFGTYVMAHLYTPESIRRGVTAGIKSFEHGVLMDEECAKMMAAKGLFLAPMPQIRTLLAEDIPQEKMTVKMKKLHQAARGESRATELINKYDLKILFGTDTINAPGQTEQTQLCDFRQYKERFGSYRGLLAATGNVHELLKLTGNQNPYPDGKIGVLEEDSFADILLVNGNPAEDLEVLCDPDNIRLIMKDGKIYKDRTEKRLQ